MGFTDTMAAAWRVGRLAVSDGPVTYTPTSGSPVTVSGVFDAAYLKVDVGQPGIASVSPAAFLTLADLPSNPLTDTTATVTIAGSTYIPHEVQPDGIGGVLLLLHKV